MIHLYPCSMEIAKNTVVTLQFRLHRDSADGKLIDEATAESPLVFIYGVEELLPRFAAQIEDLEVGDSFEFTIPAKNAYGRHKPELVVVLPIDSFAMDEETAKEMLVPGKLIPLLDEDGNPMDGTVVEVSEKEAKVNFNHPLAGMKLHFTGHVDDIRPATPEELEHGHVHGPGGHQH